MLSKQQQRFRRHSAGRFLVQVPREVVKAILKLARRNLAAEVVGDRAANIEINHA
jgi:hypothetical protein